MIKKSTIICFFVFINFHVSLANYAGVSIKSSPESLARMIVSRNKIVREYVYCYYDIIYFRDAETKNCRIAIDNVNEFSQGYGRGFIEINDVDTLKKILNTIVELLKKDR